MKQKKAIILTIGLLMILSGFWAYPKIEEFFQIDSCLDKGGRWDYENQLCEIKDFRADYNVALHFINDYVKYFSVLRPELGQTEWIVQRQDVTINFKAELQRILSQAEKDDPEMGLGFDPIIDAQDMPNEFEIESTENDYVIVKGKKWETFFLALKIKLVENRWLVEGSGIINIPAEKRVKR